MRSLFSNPRNTTPVLPSPAKCILAADLHGEIEHYDILKHIVIKEGISCIFLAGDLLPKDGGLWHPGNTVRTIQMQRSFIEDFLIGYLRELGEHAYIYAIFGNDDFRSNYDLVRNMGDKIHFLDKETMLLPFGNHEMYIAGYPRVALTPFLQKDWEQWDEKVGISHKAYKIDGYVSENGSHHPISFTDNADGRPTIAADLADLARKSDPHKTIYLMHEAPFDTPLDQVAADNPFLEGGTVHVGSKAMRAFIEREQPLLTMHGHIHETFRESRAFRWSCGRSVSITPSHDYKGKALSYIVFSLPGLSSITRYVQE